jgi:hypothetical protein
MAVTHRPSKSPTVPTDGGFPYWATVCGLRLNDKPLSISSDRKEVTCKKCAAPRS